MEKTSENVLSYDSASPQVKRMLDDRFVCELLGIELLEAEPKKARARLRLTERHLNGVGIVQGGVLFTLADYTFAAACNYTENPIVGIETSMSFLRSSKSGVIYAEATEVSRSRALCCAEVNVTDESGNLLARFTGRGYVFSPR